MKGRNKILKNTWKNDTKIYNKKLFKKQKFDLFEFWMENKINRIVS